MHAFSLINKAHTAIKRDMGKERSAVFIDARDTGTYVTAAHNDSVFATVQWHDKDLLETEDFAFLDNDFVKDASRASYKEIDEDDQLSMYAEDSDVVRMIANAVESIDYEPLDEISPISGVNVFAPLTKSKGIKKHLSGRENLKQAFISDGLRVFTTGHWLVQSKADDETVHIPFTILEIMHAWRGKVEWLYASFDRRKVRFHGMCSEGREVALGYYNTSEDATPAISQIQKEFSPSSHFTVSSDELFTFIRKIGKSFGTDDLIVFKYVAELQILTMYLSSREVTPEINEWDDLWHTTIHEFAIKGVVDFLDIEEFKVAWSAVYFTTCLSAMTLIEMVVPLGENGDGMKPCALIGEEADALVMPKRL